MSNLTKQWSKQLELNRFQKVKKNSAVLLLNTTDNRNPIKVHSFYAVFRINQPTTKQPKENNLRNIHHGEEGEEEEEDILQTQIVYSQRQNAKTGRRRRRIRRRTIKSFSKPEVRKDSSERKTTSSEMLAIHRADGRTAEPRQLRSNHATKIKGKWRKRFGKTRDFGRGRDETTRSAELRVAKEMISVGAHH